METPHILAILAHPGDESFLIGGTLAKYAHQGAEITLICTTVGEQMPGVDSIEVAGIYEKELRAAGAILGMHAVRFLRYPNSGMSTTDTEWVILNLMNAMRRIRPLVVITARQFDDSGHDDNLAISRLATTAFDRAYLKSFVPLSSRLCYLLSSEIIGDHDVALARGLAAAPMIRINITDYRLTKAQAIQCHMSQLSPYENNLDQKAEELEPYEGFRIVRSTGSYADMTDLLSALIEKP